jgi:hypothetical protein
MNRKYITIIVACLFLGACTTIDANANATIIAASVAQTLTVQVPQMRKTDVAQIELTQTTVVPNKASPRPSETLVSATPLPVPTESPMPIPSPTNSVPTISFTYVPPRGSTDYVTGKVTGVNTDHYVIAIYIKVSTCWTSISLFGSRPTAPIWPDGTWGAQYAAEKHDINAKIIRAYILKKGEPVPWAYCVPRLPSELDDYPMVEVMR